MSSNLPKNFPGRPASAPTPSEVPAPAPSAALPKNFTPEMARAAAALQAGAATAAGQAPSSGAAAAEQPAAQARGQAAMPGGPEVTRGEIADHFAQRIVRMVDAHRGDSSRPRLYAIEFPFTDFEFDVAYALAGRLGASLSASDAAVDDDEPARPLVMLDRVLNNPQQFERIVRHINHGQDVQLVCTRTWQLPQSVADLVDATLTIPRFDAPRFAAACVDFYELGAPPALGADADWVPNVVPRDFLLNSQVARSDIVSAVRQSVERRLRRYATDDALDLADLAGMDEAHDWARALIDEVALARSGAISWDDVGGRVILLGARGVGKTTLARAIARAAHLRYVEASASDWAPPQNEPQLGWMRMNAAFQEAMAAAPALFFVDDVDAFSIAPWAGMLPAFLEQLKGLSADDRVVLIAGAQSAEHVRFELHRRGALETTLTMPAPNSQALAKMYSVLLRGSGSTLAQADLEHIGLLSLGMTGHEVELIVRRALRRARKDGGRDVSKEDLAQAIIEQRVGPESQDRRRLMAADELRNTAYHEAGHAILELMRTRGARLRYASIIPRENGSLGFVLPGVDESRNSVTRNDIVEMVRVALAGRAAEEVFSGPEGTTSGCSNDLQQATAYLRYLMTRSGFHGLLSLDRSFEDSPELRERAESMLQAEYAHVLGLLQRHRPLLDSVAKLLIERQEVSGDELTRVVDAYRSSHPLV